MDCLKMMVPDGPPQTRIRAVQLTVSEVQESLTQLLAMAPGSDPQCLQHSTRGASHSSPKKKKSNSQSDNQAAWEVNQKFRTKALHRIYLYTAQLAELRHLLLQQLPAETAETNRLSVEAFIAEHEKNLER